jgi:pimeloyl-ACP methyl ester carboxylesterase
VSLHPVILTALAVLAGATGLGAWALLVRRWYRLTEPRPDLLRARCADGWEVAVFFRPARVRRFAEPVILAHGLAVTHLNMDFEPPYSLAHVLSEAGFDCYAVDWRGNGASSQPPPGKHRSDYCVDDHIELDAPAVMALALRHSRASQAFWLGHSLGGLVGYGAAERGLAGKLRGLVTLGSPAFFTDAPARMRRVLRWSAWAAWPRWLRQRSVTLLLAPLLGWIRMPLSDAVMNPSHIEPWLQRRLVANLFVDVSRRMLLQFRDWVLNDAFRSLDGRTDYRAALAKVSAPALVVAGAVDRLATPASVAAAFERLGSPDKTLVVLGTAHKDKMDYGHGDLLFGRGAPSEVYPLLRSWLERRATPWAP